jgi:hypothetical protein
LKITFGRAEIFFKSFRTALFFLRVVRGILQVVGRVIFLIGVVGFLRASGAELRSADEAKRKVQMSALS